MYEDEFGQLVYEVMDESVDFYVAIADNPNTPAETLAKMSTDEFYVAIADGPNTPEETISKPVKDFIPIIRRQVARNPHTPAETLAILAKDENESVRQAAAENETFKNHVDMKTNEKSVTKTHERPVYMNIYASTRENRELSNFAIRPFRYNGIYFRSVEQAYQYHKGFAPGVDSESPEVKAIQQKILSTTNGRDLRILGNSFPGFEGSKWLELSIEIMRSLIRESFAQNSEAAKRLLDTGSAILTHNQDRSHWQTDFPKILMEVRQELNNKESVVMETEAFVNDVVAQKEQKSDELTFRSVEQAYQYAKTFYSSAPEDVLEDFRRRILAVEDGSLLRRLGAEIPQVDMDAWNEMSVAIMTDIMRASFMQNPSAVEALLSTGSGQIRYNIGDERMNELLSRNLMDIRQNFSSLMKVHKEELGLDPDGGNVFVTYYGGRNVPKDAYRVSISSSTPAFIKDEIDVFFKSSYPDYKTMVEPHKEGKINDEQYTALYTKNVLERNKEKLLSGMRTIIAEAKEEGKDVYLYCWEKPGMFCHRYLFNNFLNENGIRCQENPLDRQLYVNGHVALYGEDNYKTLQHQESGMPEHIAVSSLGYQGVQFTESAGDYSDRTYENATADDVNFTFQFAVKFDTGGERCTEKAAGESLVSVRLDLLPIGDIDLSHKAVSKAAQTIINCLPQEFIDGEPFGVNLAGNGMSTLSKRGVSQESLDIFIAAVFLELKNRGIQVNSLRSGGQTGVDQSVVTAAIACDIPVTVHAPHDWVFRLNKYNDIYDEKQFKDRFLNQEYNNRVVEAAKNISDVLLSEHHAESVKEDSVASVSAPSSVDGDDGKQVQSFVSSRGYRKDDPSACPDVAFVFTENAQAFAATYGFDEKDFPSGCPNYEPKLDVSDMNGSNQACIRVGSKGDFPDNVFGIVVKKYQQDKDGKFIHLDGQWKDTDMDFEEFKRFNTYFFNELNASDYRTVVFPSQMALGKAALPRRFAEWLSGELESRYGLKCDIQKNNNQLYDGYGFTVSAPVYKLSEIEKKKNVSFKR